jgi:hypothetical protein
MSEHGTAGYLTANRSSQNRAQIAHNNIEARDFQGRDGTGRDRMGWGLHCACEYLDLMFEDDNWRNVEFVIYLGTTLMTNSTPQLRMPVSNITSINVFQTIS